MYTGVTSVETEVVNNLAAITSEKNRTWHSTEDI